MLVLGIETSCDETGVALYCTDKGLIADALYSQIELHQTYGGVVPELASRDHVRKLVPLTRQVCAQAGVSLQAIQGVAYTAGPGLIGALMSGACFARSLAFGLGVPVLGVHHLEGHLLAPMLDQTAPEFPFVALLVSGGHTQLIKVAAVGEYHLLGESLDDAAGEAFDKTAKLLGLGYPGGPAIAKLALQGQADRFKLPRPMVDRPGLDFSFSGLKTAVLTQVKLLLQEQNLAVVTELDAQTLADLARAFQDAVVDTLVIKCKRALQQTGLQRLVIAGGVSANQELRHKLGKTLRGMGAEVIYPALAYCTDNGAMIAYAGAQRLLAGQAESWQELNLRPRWPLTELRGLN